MIAWSVQQRVLSRSSVCNAKASGSAREAGSAAGALKVLLLLSESLRRHIFDSSGATEAAAGAPGGVQIVVLPQVQSLHGMQPGLQGCACCNV
jgi:hypothetical protein